MPPRVPQPKRQAADEAARTLRIWHLLHDEFRPRDSSLEMSDRLAILAVAERIAARTEN